MTNLSRRGLGAAWLALAVMLFKPGISDAYSVLTHEEVVDLLWRDDIEPLLAKRFPGATGEQLRKAHAFAYGGCLVQDMGYYPFGNKFFSDLTHYVRSGDFIVNLIRESSDLNEYAFALGALAHYSADNVGHPAINKSVALLFPTLEAKYGKAVTYANNPKAHIRTEFGFDMAQVAKNRYTSDRYHDFIGFEISQPVLERAFLDTYGIPLNTVISNEDLAIGTFRRAISRVIPEMTRVALLTRKKQMVGETPNFDARKFRYNLSRAAYHREWGKGYRRPGFGTRVLAVLVKVVPKVGPFRALDFKIPTRQTEDLYVASVNHTVDNYRDLLNDLKRQDLHLANTDFDTGRMTHASEYPLTDNAYASLLDRLAHDKFQRLTPDLQNNILTFYQDDQAPIATKNKQAAWRRTQQQLQELRSVSPREVPSIQVTECPEASIETPDERRNCAISRQN